MNDDDDRHWPRRPEIIKKLWRGGYAVLAPLAKP